MEYISYLLTLRCMWYAPSMNPSRLDDFAKPLKVVSCPSFQKASELVETSVYPFTRSSFSIGLLSWVKIIWGELTIRSPNEPG